MDMAAEGITSDSIFIQNSRPIKFVVNRINISDQDREWITDVLIPELQRLGDRGIVFGRAAASPEGPYDNNRRLANQRRASVDALLRSYGIGTDHIQYDVVAEDYDLLYTMMMLKHDAKFHDVDSLITLYADDTQRLKAAMKQHDGGKLWRYLLKEYFPKLRAVRIIVVDKRLANIDSNDLAPRPIAATIPATVADCHLRIQNADITPAYIIPATTPASTLPRREVLSVKTNVLFDFAYMPGYDRFCPIPNVALEYYPLHGHFTYGASFDCPWWQHYDEHKYFQVRNYQLHTRYYLRSGDIRKRKPGEGAASAITLRIDYKLTSVDGSNETINVKGATATVPAQYTEWKSGYAYTYIFKISQDTNGSTGGTSTGLTAISFDAVVVDDEANGLQETITTVSDNSFTTYGYKDNKVTTNGNEYVNGTDIYATVYVPAAGETAAKTVAPQKLYTVTLESGATQTINEASVANALVKGTNDATAKTWTVTDYAGKKMVVTETADGFATTVTEVPAGPGYTLKVNALKWKGVVTDPATETYYAVEYDNGTKKSYKIVKVVKNN